MKQTTSLLFSVKAALEQSIQQRNLLFQQPLQNNQITEYQLVPPAVHIGFIPFGSMAAAQSVRIPCLVIGASRADFTNESSEVVMQITAVIYDPGHQEYLDGSSQLQIQPNFDGYQTLLNLLDAVRAELLRCSIIADEFELTSPVRLTPYEEQPWPYWYGCLEFTVAGAPYPQTDYAEFLR